MALILEHMDHLLLLILHLKNRFEALAGLEVHNDEDPSLHASKLWDGLKSTYTNVSKEVLGTRKKVDRKQWFGEETYGAIEIRRALRKQLLSTKSPRLQERLKTQYREANRRVKKLAGKDKRDFVEEMASKAEYAAQRGHQGELFKITKSVCGKFHNNSNAPIMDKHGKLLATKQEQEERSAEHFQEVLNQPDPTISADVHLQIFPALDVSTDPPTQPAIVRVIQSLKNGKAPFQAEFLMTGRRASSSKFLRKGHSLTATTGVILPSSQYQARSLAGSSTTECVLLWMTTFVRSRLDSGRGEVVLTTYLPYEISLSSVQNSNEDYLSTLSTSRRPLIVCTGTHCGRFSNLMEYQAASLTLSRVTMMAIPAMLVTVTSCLKSRQA